MRTLYDVLRVAMEVDDVTMALDALIGIAEQQMQGMRCESPDTECAAQILTLVLCYPLNDTSRRRAVGLLDDLAASICPATLLDARARAEQVTLEELVSDLLAQ